MGVCVSQPRDVADSPRTPISGGHDQIDDEDFSGVPLEFDIGEVIGDKYEIAELLGRGSLGVSYMAHATTVIDSRFAIKVVMMAGKTDLVHEVRLAQKQLIKMQHANVLPVLDIMEDTEGDNMIIVSPLASRGNVVALRGKTLTTTSTTDASDCLLTQIAHDIGVGLRVLHSHDVFHLNLHPGNVFQLKTGSFAVSEAGFHPLMRSFNTVELMNFRRQGLLAPEILRAESNINIAKTDTWAFGVFLFEMAFGREPFPWGATPDETIRNIIATPVRMPVAHKDLPTDLAEVLVWAMEKLPENRPNITRLLRHKFFRCGSNQSFLKFNSGGALTARSTAGRFVIEKVLGKGPHAETMLVTSPQAGARSLILKIFDRSIDMRFSIYGSQEMQRIKQMVALSKKIRHKCIGNYIEVVNTDNAEKDKSCQKESFATVEYFVSGDVAILFPTIDPTGPNIITMLTDVLFACYELRCQGLYHGNLKPSNVVRTQDGFAVVDFGPLMRAPGEFFSESGDCVLDLPQTIIGKLRAGEGFEHVDAFAIGLLAASIDPSIRTGVWDIYHRLSADRLNVEKIVKVIAEQSATLPTNYASFVQTALTQCPTLTDLMRHPLLDIGAVNYTPLSVEEKELKGWVRQRFQHDAEQRRLTDYLGPAAYVTSPQYTYLEGGARSASAVSVESEAGTAAAGDDDDGAVTIEYDGEVLRCPQCHIALTVVVYRHPRDPAHVRCAKCMGIDPVGAELVPYVVQSVQMLDDDVDSTRKMSVLLPTDRFTAHGIQELEMAADLPTGQLAASATPKMRALSVSRMGLNASRSRSTTMPPSQQPQQPKKLLSEAEARGELTPDELVADAVEHSSTELLLNECQLARIPPRLYDPPILSLRVLDLSRNLLRVIPHDISYLTSLEKLVMSHNQLTELPESIGDLPELRHLDVSHNQLMDLPPSLMFAEKLESISMDYNRCAAIPGVLSDMPWLTTVYLVENPDIKSFLKIDEMQKLGELKLGLDNEPSLWATYNQIKAQIPRITIMWNKVYPDMIVPGLYCGSLRSAQTPHVYERLGINYLLTVGRGLNPTTVDGMRHKVVIVDDIEGATIDNSFDEAIDFIREAKAANSGCLVHCFAGLSRSATTVIAYLMREHGMRLDEAYLTTKRGRPAIYPNHGFFEQLKKYDATLFPDGRPLDIPSLERDKIPT